MVLKTEPTRVVYIGDPGQTEEQIKSAFGNEQEFKLADALNSSEMLARDVRAATPEIVVIDFMLGGQTTLDNIDDLAIQFPDIPLVAILPSENPVQAQQVMLAGARAFIFQPFTQINLLSTLRRVRDLEGRHRQSRMANVVAMPESTRPIKAITVYSSRGGTGTSTIAVNLAISLAEQTESRVLLMEGKLSFGHINVLLNIRPQNTIADLLPHANNLDEALISDVIIRHPSGISVLLAPSNLQVSQGIRPDDLYNLFMSIQKWFDYIIIDGGSSLNENTVTLMDASDRIMLVANPDLASLHDTSMFIQLSRSLAYPADKILIVLNRAGQLGGVRPRDIESVMHYSLFAQVPDDSMNALRSLNRGVPLLVRYPRSPASQAIQHLAKSLTTISTAEAQKAATADDQTRREALLASSRLG